VRGQHRADDLCSRGGRPLPGDDRADLLERELGGEVVADDVHVAQDLGERRRPVHGERPAARPSDLRPARHPDPCTRECLAEQADGAGRVRNSFDRERRERLRLERDEAGFPPWSGPPRVEPRLVGDQAAGHAADAGGADVLGEAREPGPVEGRVSAPLQHQVAGPDAGRAEPALAQHRGLHPEGRAERLERRVGDDELLVRGGEKCGLHVVRVHDPAGAEIDGERRGARPVEAGERGVQARAQRGSPGRLGQEHCAEGASQEDANRGPGTHRR
jgi:hypothetical protein